MHRAPLWLHVLALASVLGCGGGTQGGGGSLASCGNDCSPAQVSAACSTICEGISKAGCSSGTGPCPMGCESIASMTPSCSSLALAFLRCAESSAATCVNGGVASYAACDAQKQMLSSCLTTTSGPPTVSGCFKDTVCPGIPTPAGAASCSSSGSASQSGPAMVNESCQDTSGNVWQAICTGSTCTCTYNGGSACACTMSDAGCSTCCPGVD